MAYGLILKHDQTVILKPQRVSNKLKTLTIGEFQIKSSSVIIPQGTENIFPDINGQHNNATLASIYLNADVLLIK